MTAPRVGTLLFLSGKMAAGKSTLARQLADRDDAILLVQDHFLATLFPDQIRDVADYLTYSRRLNAALAPHVRALLGLGLTVVLDFPANTRRQRAWFREVLAGSGAGHVLHYVDASDAVCKRQLAQRSAHLPPGTPWTTEAEFDAITALFEPPAGDEAFTVVRHERG
jgi:predicted kinase